MSENFIGPGDEQAAIAWLEGLEAVPSIR